MKTMIVTVTAAALVTSGSVGCSSGQAGTKPRHGVLPAGTARLTVDGNDAGTTGSVECAVADSLTTIRTGHNSAGVTVMVSNAARLAVEFVRIRNVNGFSGDYNLGVQGDAAAALTDATYHISGTALGYSPKSIEPTTHSFIVEVAC